MRSIRNYFLIAANITYNFIDMGTKQELAKSKIQANQTALYYAHMQNGIKVDVEQKPLNLKAKTSIIDVKLKTEI